MSTTIENASLQSETFRNNPLLIATVLLASVVGFLVAPCLAILCIATLFPLEGYTLERLFLVVSYLVASWFALNSGINLWRLGRGMVHQQATLYAEGLRFRQIPEKHPDNQEEFVAWDQIAAIRHRRMGHNQFYSVVTKDNRVLAFDALAFFRSRKLAEHISNRAGLSIQELK